MKIEDRSLALPGRARAEQNETGGMALLELPQQRVVHGMIEGGGVPGIITVEANGGLYLRQLHQFIPARRACGRQRDDDVAVQETGQKQGAQVRRIVAADCKRVAGFDPALRQFAEPSIAALAELVK